MTAVRALLGLAAMAGVVSFALWIAGEKRSPGPLSPVHAAIPGLWRDCAGCHGGSGEKESDLASACIRCHDAIARQRETGTGLHGALGRTRYSRCGRCHLEHHGAAVPLVDDRVFGLAGIQVLPRDAHRFVDDFVLSGRHASLPCEACHEHATAEVLPAGSMRFLGLEQQCTSCHDDAHDGQLGRDCARCHGQERPFPEAPGFDHDPRFPLTGGHAGVACRSCHESPVGAGTPRFTDPPARSEVRRCGACHEDVHRGGSREALRFRTEGSCEQCHDVQGFSPARFTARDHAQVAMPLLGAHEELDCAACHSDRPWQTGAGPVGAADCAACHESPHAESFAAAAGTGCRDCHALEAPGFRYPHASMSRARHAATGFALAAPHDDLDCAACHDWMAGDATRRETRPFADRFPGRDPTHCGTCHGDPHGDQFEPYLKRAGHRGPAQQQCAACHRSDRFVPTSFGVEEHAQSAFPLTGAHRAITCSACHPKGEGIRRFAGTPTTCADCHDDPHHGAFDVRPLDRREDRRTDCARCHETNSFRAVDWNRLAESFDHGRITGYPLLGAHSRTTCSACHQDNATGRTVARPPKSCASCHDDPHDGQFAETIGDGRTRPADCARCHDAAKTFRETTFDHGRTRFPLDATHSRLACARCHFVEQRPGGRQVVRYRPLASSCRDCHGGERR